MLAQRAISAKASVRPATSRAAVRPVAQAKKATVAAATVAGVAVAAAFAAAPVSFFGEAIWLLAAGAPCVQPRAGSRGAHCA